MKKDFNFILFMETSAKTGFNVKELFVKACKILYNESLEYQKILEKNEDNSINIKEYKEKEEIGVSSDIMSVKIRKKKGCC